MKNQADNPGYRVLVIHSFPVVRDGLSNWLNRRGGNSVTLAAALSTVEEALAWLENGRVDVLLLEARVSGTKLLESVDRLRACCDAHLLLLTTAPDGKGHDQAVMRGVRGILPLDLDASTLLRAVERVADGELWLSREATGRIIEAMTSGESTPHLDPHRARFLQLTERERQVVVTCLAHGGAPARRLAEQLHISEHTLRNHLTSIYGKLRVSSRLELHAYAHDHAPAGWVE